MFKDFFLNIQLLSDNAKMPTRAHDGDAGLDLYTPEKIIIFPHSDKLIPLDIRVEFPKGFAMIIQEKSGVATKKKIDIGACVVDADFRGNVQVHLINNSDEKVYLEKKSKIAQALVYPVWDGQPLQVDYINTDTDRAESGFGSTGEK